MHFKILRKIKTYSQINSSEKLKVPNRDMIGILYIVQYMGSNKYYYLSLLLPVSIVTSRILTLQMLLCCSSNVPK